MQDKILLGFLVEGPKTGYDIKKAMEISTDLFFNSSAGSIYPAFQKLIKEKLATKENKTENGRAKIIYTITPQGKEVFLQWLNNSLPVDKVKQESLLRTFFLSHLPIKAQEELFKNFIDDLTTRKEELIDLQSKLSKFDIDSYQMTTLQFGIDYYNFMMQWHQNFIKDNFKK